MTGGHSPSQQPLIDPFIEYVYGSNNKPSQHAQTGKAWLHIQLAQWVRKSLGRGICRSALGGAPPSPRPAGRTSFPLFSSFFSLSLPSSSPVGRAGRWRGQLALAAGGSCRWLAPAGCRWGWGVVKWSSKIGGEAKCCGFLRIAKYTLPAMQ